MTRGRLGLNVTAPVRSTRASAPTRPCRRKPWLLAQAPARTVRKPVVVSGPFMFVMFDPPLLLQQFRDSPETSKNRAKMETQVSVGLFGGCDHMLPIPPPCLLFSWAKEQAWACWKPKRGRGVCSI